MEHIILMTIELEGGFVNSKSDPGGATMYGISSRFNPQYADKINAGELTLVDALHIYSTKYWNRHLSVLLDNNKPGMAFIIFDSIISGQRSTISFIQKYINDNSNIRIDVDGKFGRKTVEAILLANLDDSIIKALIANAQQLGRYEANKIMKAQENLGLKIYDYSVGMTNRVNHRCQMAMLIKC